MTYLESCKAIYKGDKGIKGIIHVIKWNIPIKRCKGHTFYMLPHWYNGHFSWQSINKWPD